MKRIRRHLYKRGSIYYYLQRVNGKQRWISLKTSDSKQARKLADELNARFVLAGAGLGRQPKLNVKMQSIKAVLDFYAESGCPKTNGVKRDGRQLVMEKGWTANLSRHLGHFRPDSLDPSDWQTYTQRRKEELKGKGDRTIDVEYRVLVSAYRWARRNPRRTGVTGPPLPEAPAKLNRPETVAHCRDFQPANADELHKIAAHLLAIPGDGKLTSTVNGWLLLIASMIGQRLSEVLRLRHDATTSSEPGFDDGKHLWLYRSKTHKGTAPFIEIGPELRECLDAHREWKEAMHPLNPWFFPSPVKAGAPINSTSFQHALAKATKDLGLPKRTAHGLRSYYVNVLRSEGLPDHEIALRIGQKSGGKLIVDVYGERLPIKLGWKPSGKVAWERWKPNNQILRMA